MSPVGFWNFKKKARTLLRVEDSWRNIGMTMILHYVREGPCSYENRCLMYLCVKYLHGGTLLTSLFQKMRESNVAKC